MVSLEKLNAIASKFWDTDDEDFPTDSHTHDISDSSPSSSESPKISVVSKPSTPELLKKRRKKRKRKSEKLLRTNSSTEKVSFEKASESKQKRMKSKKQSANQDSEILNSAPTESYRESIQQTDDIASNQPGGDGDFESIQDAEDAGNSAKKRKVVVVDATEIIQRVDRFRGIGKEKKKPRKVDAFKKTENMAKKFYRSTYQIIDELGAAHLKGKEKKDWAARKVTERGGKAPKSQKVPFRIMKGMRRKQKNRESSQRERDREAGNLVRKVRKSRLRDAPTDNPVPTVGHLEQGVLRVRRGRLGAGPAKRGGRMRM
eukprot:271589_1